MVLPGNITSKNRHLILYNSSQWLLTLAISCMPFFFADSSRLKNIPFAILFIGGIYIFWTQKQLRSQYAKAGWIMATCLLILAYAIVNILWHKLYSLHLLDLPLQIILFVVIAAVFTLPLNRSFIWSSFSLTGAILGIVAIWQHYFLGIPRPYGLNGGPWSAIEYAMILLILGLLSINHLLHEIIQPGITKRAVHWLHGICAAIALYGAILTKSRGPLLALPIVLVILAFQYSRYRTNRRPIFISLGTILFGYLLIIFCQHGFIQRLNEGQIQIIHYPSDQNSAGSVQERLDMWRSALHATVDHPIFGIGLNQFGNYNRQQVALGHNSPTTSHYNHPHSEYLEAAATGGMIGLTVLMLTFLVPLIFFLRRFSKPSAFDTLAASAGVIVVTMYMVCALTDNVFYRAMPHSLYFFFITGFAVWSAHKASTTDS